MFARRRLLSGLIGAAVAFTALALWIRASPTTDQLPEGDLAVIESYTLQATRGRALLGPYSRFGWNHPGPLYFYALAPLYMATGERTTAIYAEAGVLNVVALMLAIGVAAVAARGTFAIALASGSALYAFRASETMTSAWNPHVLPPAFIALVVLASATMSSRKHLWPWVVAYAAFLTQTHIGTVPTVVAVGVTAIAGAWQTSDDRRRLARWLAGAGALWLTLWVPSLIEEWRYHPGNLSLIWNFFESRRPAHPWPEAFVLWADLLSGLFRPGFEVPWGGVIDVDRTGVAAPIALTQVTLVAVGTWVAIRERQTFQRSMGILLLVASAVSLWSVTRLSGELLHYAVFWIVAIGVLNCAFVVDLLADALGIRIGERSRGAVVAACVTLAVVALIPVRRETANLLAEPEERLRDGLLTRRLTDALTDYIRANPARGRPLIRTGGESWWIAAGVIVGLQKTGLAFSVDRDAVPMFSEAVGPTGRETWTVTIAGGKQRDEILVSGAQKSIADRDGIFVFVDPSPPPFEPRRR